MKSVRCEGSKWYRFAIGEGTPAPNSTIVNFANDYNNTNQRSALFYIFASNHGSNHIERLDSGRMLVSKIRIIYQKNIQLVPLYVDALFSFGKGSFNNIAVNYSCNIHFQFRPLTEVPDDVEEGYTVDEFSFE